MVQIVDAADLRGPPLKMKGQCSRVGHSSGIRGNVPTEPSLPDWDDVCPPSGAALCEIRIKGLTDAAGGATTQVYQLYIKATQEQVWEAITDRETRKWRQSQRAG